MYLILKIINTINFNLVCIVCCVYFLSILNISLEKWCFEILYKNDRMVMRFTKNFLQKINFHPQLRMASEFLIINTNNFNLLGIVSCVYFLSILNISLEKWCLKYFIKNDLMVMRFNTNSEKVMFITLQIITHLWFNMH